MSQLIYLLEDDDSVSKLVIYALERQGYTARGFSTPAAFWKALDLQLPELLLMDIMLPEDDGLVILQKLRNSVATKKLPIIMLTAKNSEFDRVIGLDNGADDIISKPFGMMELEARIRAVLRRTEVLMHNKEYHLDSLFVCPDRHIVKVNGSNVVLTCKEFEILCLLLENEGVVLRRATLMDKIWGCELERENRTLDVHIRTLRAKLGEAGNLIETVRGIGYKIGGNE